eukprot:7609066-Pyramimonas_sp.AAC.1
MPGVAYVTNAPAGQTRRHGGTGAVGCRNTCPGLAYWRGQTPIQLQAAATGTAATAPPATEWDAGSDNAIATGAEVTAPPHTTPQFTNHT